MDLIRQEVKGLLPVHAVRAQGTGASDAGQAQGIRTDRQSKIPGPGPRAADSDRRFKAKESLWD